MASMDMALATLGQVPASPALDLGTNGKTRLPGLALLFLAGLGLGGILCGFYAFYMLQQFDQVYNLANLGWAVGNALGLVLCCGVGWSIHIRAKSAPLLCRILLIMGIIVSLALFVRTMISFVGDEPLAGREGLVPRLKILTTLHVFPSIAIICEAWRRCFRISPNVRQAFNISRPEEETKEIPPVAIGLFATACWLCLVSTIVMGFGILWLWKDFASSLWQVLDLSGVTFTAVQSAIARTISQFILPLVALYALRARRLPVIFWCLWLWLGLEVLSWVAGLIYLTYLPAKMGLASSNFYLDLLPNLLSQNLLLPLIFWWYLSVSPQTQAWFGTKCPPPADKAA